MVTQNLNTLWDISIWGNDEHKMCLRWGIANNPPDLEEDWNALKLYLQGKSPLKKRGKYKRGWGTISGTYTTAAGYQLTNAHPNVPPNPTIWKAIWTSKSIPKIAMFIWTLAHISILTGIKPKKKGVGRPQYMSLCLQAEETRDHLLLKCSYSKEFWQLALGL
jgi:hypothetical protein